MIELPRKPDGKRNRRFRRTKTRHEAQRKLKEMQSELEKKRAVAGAVRTVPETLAEYVETVRSTETQAIDTIGRDLRWQKRMSAYFQNKRVLNLTVRDCDALLELIASGQLPGGSGQPVSRSYVRRARSFLTAALNNDRRLGYLTQNSAAAAIIPTARGSRKAKRALTLEEWNDIFQAADERTKLAVDFGGRHGLRPQEVRSLRWKAIDLTTSTIRIDTQFSATNEFVGAKTKASYRSIHLHPETRQLLENYQRLQQLQRETARAVWEEQDLIITTKRGTPINKDNHHRSLRRVCVKAGVEPITPHELRHTAITHQLEAGFTVSQVADWAGTSEKMIYEHYRHKIREVVEIPPANVRKFDP